MISILPASRRKTIQRIPKVRGFLVVDNGVFNDVSLTWEARGLMGYLLSKPDHWQVRLHDLLNRGPAGEHKVRRMLHELKAAGYIRTRRLKRVDGTFDWLTEIYESPGRPLQVTERDLATDET